MAELVGVLSSGIAIAGFAGQLVKQAIALRRLWNEIHDAPEDVFNLIDQLEWLQPMITSMEQSLDDGSPKAPDGAEQCLTQCGKALTNLQKLATDLSQTLTSNKRIKKALAKIKVVVKKEQILKYQSRLENALNGLHTACLIYNMNQCSLIQKHTSTIITKIDTFEESIKSKESAPPAHKPPVENVTQRCSWYSTGWFWNSNYTTQGYDESGQRQNSVRMRLQPPLWLSRFSLDFIIQHETCGWKISLYPRTIRPYPELVLRVISQGSSSELFTTLSETQRTIYDYDESGQSLLHLALRADNVDIALGLIDTGVKLDEADNSGWTPFAMICSPIFTISNRNYLLHKFANTGLLYKYAHLYKVHGAGVISRIRALEDAQLNIPGAAEILRDVPYLGLQTVSLDRIYWHHVRHATNLLNLIRSGAATGLVEFQKATRNDFKQAIHGFALFYFDSQIRETEQNVLGPERRLLRILFAGATTSDISPTNARIGSGRTPLFNGIHWAYLCHCPPLTMSYDCKVLNRNIRDWLEDLATCGIDLEEYGKRESTIYSAGKWVFQDNGFSIEDWNGERMTFFGPRVARFSYGPTPADWVFEWDHLVPQYARDFWEMVEALSPSGMPGSWIDED